jgi:hypothetical protein
MASTDRFGLRPVALSESSTGVVQGSTAQGCAAHLSGLRPAPKVARSADSPVSKVPPAVAKTKCPFVAPRIVCCTSWGVGFAPNNATNRPRTPDSVGRWSPDRAPSVGRRSPDRALPRETTRIHQSPVYWELARWACFKFGYQPCDAMVGNVPAKPLRVCKLAATNRYQSQALIAYVVTTPKQRPEVHASLAGGRCQPHVGFCYPE